MLGDTPDYAAMATPVTSVQVANSCVRRIGYLRRYRSLDDGEKIGDLVMDGKKALNLPR
jgi:hypothetical protein